MCGKSATVKAENRVGVDVYGLDQLLVGDTVRFHYASGSRPGYRTVYINKVDDNGLEGPTHERSGDYRRYSHDYIGYPITIVASEHQPEPISAGSTRRVRFDEAGSALLASLSGEQLAELYAKHVAIAGDGAEFDHQTGEVVVYLPEPKNVVSYVDDNVLELTNKNSVTFSIFLSPEQQSIGVLNGQNNTNYVGVTPEQLRDELVKFLS